MRHLVLTVVVIYFTTLCQAKFNLTSYLIKNYGKPELPFAEAKSARLGDGTGPLSYDDYPWINMILKLDDDSAVSHGAFYNQYWVITSGAALSQYIDTPGDLYVAYGMSDLGDLSTANARMVNEVIVHEDMDLSRNDIALVRICPKVILSYAPLPSEAYSYTAGPIASLIAYDDDLSGADKAIGERCECADVYPEEYDSTLDICLQEHPSVFAEADDYPAVSVILDSELVGMITIKQNPNGGGEVAIDLSEYLNWISDNAVYP